MDERFITHYARSLKGQGRWIQPDESGFMNTDCTGFIFKVLQLTSGLGERVKRFNGDQAFWRSAGPYTAIRSSYTTSQRSLHADMMELIPDFKIAELGDKIDLGISVIRDGLNIALYHEKGSAEWGSFIHAGFLDPFNNEVIHLPDSTLPGIKVCSLREFVLDGEALSGDFSPCETVIVRVPVISLLQTKNLRNDAPEMLDEYFIPE